jgi:hypothetical protein
MPGPPGDRRGRDQRVGLQGRTGPDPAIAHRAVPERPERREQRHLRPVDQDDVVADAPSAARVADHRAEGDPEREQHDHGCTPGGGFPASLTQRDPELDRYDLRTE